MRKALLVVMSVAILGALGLYINKKPAQSMGGSQITNTSQATNKTTTPAVQSDTSANSDQNSSASSSPTGQYKDGTYNGTAVNNVYGTVQVAAVVSGGKITDIKFLQMPNSEGNSRVVTAMAEPQLKSETLSAQSAHIDFVSGATQTSESYEQSLQAALDQAAA